MPNNPFFKWIKEVYSKEEHTPEPDDPSRGEDLAEIGDENLKDMVHEIILSLQDHMAKVDLEVGHLRGIELELERRVRRQEGIQ